MTNITFEDMIKCVEREIGMRKKVYPRWVEAKKISQEKADFEIKCMTAFLDQLKIAKSITKFMD